MAKIVDIAAQIHEELGEPSDMTIASISFWLQTNLGELNVLLNSDFVLGDDLEVGGLGVEEAAILKKMYECYFYGKRMKETLYAAGVDQVISVTSDGSSVKKLNKGTLSKTYLDAQKQCKEDLNMMVKGYKRFIFKPLQNVGDDTLAAGDISPQTRNSVVDQAGRLL